MILFVRSRSGLCWSSVLPRIDAEFLHSREERGPIDAHACCGAIGTTDAALALGKHTYNFLALLLSAIIHRGLIPIESVKGFLHNSSDVFLT